MKTLVLSLGGSVIIPDRIDFAFLEKFKSALQKHYKTHKFVIVCGGGSIARKYIAALAQEHRTEKQLSLAGIRATRMNALFLMQFFGKVANSTLPLNMKEIHGHLHKNKVVICGALRFVPDSTSDGTAARVANSLKTEFINITNVPGLYTANPATHKNAKFISEISWAALEKMALGMKFEPGQHFILDQEAAVLIRKNRTSTYIVGRNLKNLSSLIAGKKFKGTTISG